MNYEQLIRRAIIRKQAAAALTQEAQQMPPQGAPMDPSMMQQMPPQGAPMDPSMMQQMPPQGAPMDPSMMQQMPPQGAPMDPSMMQQMPPQGTQQLPPEVYQDPQFQQMLAQIAGIALDPNAGTFVDVQSGQPVPPDYIMQAWQAYQQQQGVQPAQGMDESMQTPTTGQLPPETTQTAEDPVAQLQQVVDETVQHYTEGLEKKVDALSDMLRELLEAVQALKDTSDTRTVVDKDVATAVREEIARELQPAIKTASNAQRPFAASPRPLNILDILRAK